MTRLVLATAVLFAIFAAPAAAQTPLVVTPGFAADKYLEAQAPIELTLSRLPEASEGRLAVLVGTADLTSLFELTGTKMVFRSNGVTLPAGESELKIFLVVGKAWNEVAKLPIRILTSRGFEKAEISPGLELRNTGQLAEGHSGSQAAPDRSTFQTLGATIGLQTSHVREGASLTSDTHFLGTSEENQALRFGEQGSRASRLDLADYVVRFEGKKMQIAVGQVSTGLNRHLINGFSSRGVTATLGGPAATITLAAENGSSIVGLGNITGLTQRDHRILSSNLGMELFPKRPGALHLDATVLHGSLLPVSGYNQSGVTSAEQSDGYGLQLAASTPSQRVRFAAGLSSSKSGFTADPSGSTVATTQHRKGARYAELNMGLLQGNKLFKKVPVTLNLALKHERIDPMYRSVALMTQADIQRNGIEAAGNVDALSVQMTQGWSVDNLNAVASLLTTRTRSSILTLGASMAALLRVTHGASWLPSVSYMRQGMHQYGDGIPTGGAYTASDIPDQMTVMQNASAQWQVKQWQLGYRLTQSDQDNRQPGHQLADVSATTHGVTIGVAVGSALTLGLDLGLESQDNKETAQVNTVRKAGLTTNWRPLKMTTLDASVTLSRTNDPASNGNTHVSGVQLNISRGFNLWRPMGNAPRGQVFLRYIRQSYDVFSISNLSAPPTTSTGMWNVASGLTLRLF